MKRFLTVLIASMFLASAAIAAEKMGDEKKAEGKGEVKDDAKGEKAAKDDAKGESETKGEGKATKGEGKKSETK